MGQNAERQLQICDQVVAQAELVEQIRQLQQRVEELAVAAGAGETETETEARNEVSAEVKEFIRTILKIRANRHAVFGSTLFGEPSWDMLLELFDARYRGRREYVSSLC